MMRIISLAKMLVILTMTTCCGQVLAKERIDVLFLNPGFEHGFWGNVTNTMSAAAEDLSINLEVLSANRDRIKMLDLIRGVARRDVLPDYAVIVNELQQGAAIAQILESVGVPYFFLLNRLSTQKVDELKKVDAMKHYIGSIAPDNSETGYMTAKAMINAHRIEQANSDNIRLLALLGDTATPAAVEREAGMRRAVDESSNVEIVRAFSVDWLFDRAKRAVDQFLLRSHADIIWTASGPIAFGAIEAVEEANLEPGKDVKFAGVGWFPNALDAVLEETMVMTYGGYFISGAWAMVVLHDFHAGIALESEGELIAPLTEVNLANIGQFQKHIRNIDWSVVDFSRFTRMSSDRSTYDFSAENLLQNISANKEKSACIDC